MSLELFIVLAFFIPLLLAAAAGWTQAEKIGPWLAALPVPVIVLLFFLPEGFDLMKNGDGTDMGQTSGYLAVIFGSSVAAISFVVGLAAALVKRGRIRRH
jgi:hypothetical protein